jgi:general secretion pathway protein G
MNQPLSKRPRHIRRRQLSGFTLIEVLLVLVILVILGSIAVPMFAGIGEEANKRAAKAQVGMLESAIDMYNAIAFQYPTTLEDLVVQPSTVKSWAGPYLKENKSLIDPWQNPYKYNNQGTKSGAAYDVWSMGPDGQDGSDDDIGNWPDAI